MSSVVLPPPADAADIEATAQALRSAALAVSSAHGDAVFPELVRTLATVLHVEIAFIALFVDNDPTMLEMRAMVVDGEERERVRYDLEGTPCATVVGRRFCFYPSRVSELFPMDEAFRRMGVESYAGFPVNDSHGRALGLIAAVSRRPMQHEQRVESILQIYAVRAAAEIERARAEQALRDSEGSYRALFDAAEDSVFIHDWDTFAVVDVNAKACETYGYAYEELVGISIADISSGVPPYTEAEAARWMRMARDGNCPPFEWQRRNKDGSLHWDEVRLKRIALRGRPHIVAFTRDITARKLAEQALRSREEQYRAIFEGSTDALAVWSRGIRIVDVNRAFERMYGYARAEVLDGGFSPNLTAEEILPRVHMIRRALAGEEGVLETFSRRKDGQKFDVELRYLPIEYHGEPHVLVIARDITERKEAEEQLRQREEQYRVIFEAASDAFVLCDEHGRILDANPAFYRMYGFTDEAALKNEGYPAHFPREYVEGRRAQLRRALEGHGTHIETMALRADGSPLWIDLRVIPVSYRGKPYALQVARDISALREREMALQRSEARLRATVEAAFDSVIAMDQGGCIVEFNAAAERCFGHPREAVLGKPLADVLIPERFREAHRHGLQEFGRTGRGRYVGRLLETVALRADGTEFPVEVAISVAKVPEGNIFVGHLRDITSRRLAEARRGELESQLRQAQKMEAIGQLTGGIAHDFNNILTSVIGYVVLAGERAANTGDARLVRQLEQAQVAAERARDLVGQMLAFARRQRAERRAVALAPVVRQAVQLLRATLPSTIEIHNVDRDADPEEATSRVAADVVQLEQVLFNLCINARDAIAGTGRISVRTREIFAAGWRCASCRARIEPGMWVELSVGDSGCGIAPDVAERMFDPFFSTKEVGRGSGMGLAMVHGIVHEHGGHLRVDTRLGEGSTFAVLLPPVREGAQAPAPAAPSAGEPSPRAPLRGRVLVVEDQPMVGEYLAELLEGWGLEIVRQPDGERAAQWLADPANTVSVMVTDQTMPRMTGLELAQRAHLLRPALPIVLYTGDAGEFDPEELQRCGVLELLRKPMVAEALRATLRRCLSGG